MNRISKYLKSALCVGLFLMSTQLAVAGDQADFKVVGTKQLPIVLHNDPSRANGTLNDGSPIARITTPILEINPEALKELQNRVRALQNGSLMPKASAGASDVKLGMNGVPVLNQGVHGTCVTFAVTAALDAAIYQEDKISQLCSLELGSFLEKSKPNYYISGWDGSFASMVFEQFKSYGAIEKQHEQTGACGGLRSYPVRSAFTGKPMSINDYTAKSTNIMDKVKIDELLSEQHAFSNRVSRNALIENLKASLRDGNRIVAGMGLDPDSYNAGFIGSHKTDSDTWVVTKRLKNKILYGRMNQFAGHEILIHGYDDTVVVNGQRGVFILRNSWGNRFGDKGNAYVTYDYVKLLMTDAQAIVPN